MTYTTIFYQLLVSEVLPYTAVVIAPVVMVVAVPGLCEKLTKKIVDNLDYICYNEIVS